jgi:uncharacterized protein YdhG (YjbR/CyaY superfamily)
MTLNSIEEYISSLPNDRKDAIAKLRHTISQNLPKGYVESPSYGMIGYVVPHSLYPKGYHVDPKQPLPFIHLASQKSHIAIYHMGIYVIPEFLEWFKTEYPKHCKTKLDMGKSCIRFKKTDEIPYELIAELVKKISPEEWIVIYEKQLVG